MTRLCFIICTRRLWRRRSRLRRRRRRQSLPRKVFPFTRRAHTLAELFTVVLVNVNNKSKGPFYDSFEINLQSTYSPRANTPTYTHTQPGTTNKTYPSFLHCGHSVYITCIGSDYSISSNNNNNTTTMYYSIATGKRID